ncbi:hypothetical protein K490DRAFT_57589 [Saccharata proteae CBS 121410]|uniref:Uncharacterized protein n=1 Tax=Saccharata proteae CBS 121410 TaxID=1314787 RepID=A0A9P4HW24_9PEZI|nr:hypothetical protein K490DRAFT_57589 [Saccharata proteae CBS 121410]
MTSAEESLQSQLQNNRAVGASDEAYTSITRKAGEGFARAFGSVKRKASRATSNVTGIFGINPGEEKSNGSPFKSHTANTPKTGAPLSPFNSASRALRHARSSLEIQTKGQISPGRFGSLRRVAHSTIGRTRQSLSVGRKEDLPFPTDPDVHRSSPIAVPPALNVNSVDIPNPSIGDLNDPNGLAAWQQELRDATIVVGSIPKPALPDVAMHLAKASRSAPKRSPRPPPLNISLEGSPKRVIPDAQPTPLPGTTFGMGDLDGPSDSPRAPRSRLPTEIEDYPILSAYAEDDPKPSGGSPPERPHMTEMKITALPFSRLTHGKVRKSVDTHQSPERPRTPPPSYEAVSPKSRRYFHPQLHENSEVESPTAESSIPDISMTPTSYFHPQLHKQSGLESPTAESSIAHISTTPPTSYFHKIQSLKDPNAGHVNHITGAWQSDDSTTPAVVPEITNVKPLLRPHISFDEPLILCPQA